MVDFFKHFTGDSYLNIDKQYIQYHSFPFILFQQVTIHIERKSATAEDNNKVSFNTMHERSALIEKNAVETNQSLDGNGLRMKTQRVASQVILDCWVPRRFSSPQRVPHGALASAASLLDGEFAYVCLKDRELSLKGLTE